MPIAALQHFKNHNSDDCEIDALMDAAIFL